MRRLTMRDVGRTAIPVIAALMLFHSVITRNAFTAREPSTHYHITAQYLAEITAGRVPQTLPAGFDGGGYAFPRYYPPFAYLASTAVAWLVGDPVLGVHLALLGSVVASALAMFYLARSLSGSAAAAVGAALLYATFPYRFVDVFIRVAPAESWSFVWYPLLAAGAFRIRRDGRFPWFLPPVIAVALLTHPITLVWFGLVSGLVVLLLPRRPAGSEAVQVGIAAALGLGLSLGFLLVQQVRLHDVWAGDPTFLWATPAFARAHDILRPAPGFRQAITGLVSLDVAGMCAALLLAGVGTRLGGRRRLALALAAVWLLLVLIMTFPAPVFSVLPAWFRYIQFPWRLLGIAGFVSCLASALAIAALPRRAAIACAACIIAFSFVWPPAVLRHVTSDPALARLPLSDTRRMAYADHGFTVLGEYAPRDATPDSLLALVRRGPVVLGDGRVVRWVRKGGETNLTVVSGGAVRLIVPLLYYDFYQARLGARTVATRNVGGMLAVDLPPGTSSLHIAPRLTPLSWLGIAISAVTLAGWIGVLLRRAHRARTPAAGPTGVAAETLSR